MKIAYTRIKTDGTEEKVSKKQFDKDMKILEKEYERLQKLN